MTKDFIFGFNRKIKIITSLCDSIKTLLFYIASFDLGVPMITFRTLTDILIQKIIKTSTVCQPVNRKASYT